MPQPDFPVARPASGSDTAPVPNALLVEEPSEPSPDFHEDLHSAPESPDVVSRSPRRRARHAEQRAQRTSAQRPDAPSTDAWTRPSDSVLQSPAPASADGGRAPDDAGPASGVFSRASQYARPDARTLRDEQAAGRGGPGYDDGRPARHRHVAEPPSPERRPRDAATAAAPPVEASPFDLASVDSSAAAGSAPLAEPTPFDLAHGDRTAAAAQPVDPTRTVEPSDEWPVGVGSASPFAPRPPAAPPEDDLGDTGVLPPLAAAEAPYQLAGTPSPEPGRRGGVGGLLDRARPLVLGATRRGAAVRAAGALALVVALVAGLTTWSVLDRTVLVDVDGEISEVSFLGSEVTDALAAADVTVGEEDLVSPAVGSTIGEGETVTVRFARPFTVVVDGEARTYVTHGLTVEEAIAALDLRLEGAVLSASRSTPIGREGLDIEVITPKEATVVLAGAEQTTTTTARTVRDLLVELGAEPDDDDRVDPALDTVVTAGMRVTYSRVDVTEITEEVPIPAPSRTEEDDDLAVGETEVVEEGVDGVETVYYRVVTVDGEEELREEVRREVTTEPVEEVVREGTQEQPGGDPVPAPGGDVASLNWAALAECESGGNPTIVSPNGLYHGLYQFDAGTWQSVGGSGVASQAPASEQTARAQILYEQRGSSPWPHCGSRLYS